MCSTPCKIRSTHCKICSIKQSYPQVIPRVIPKKVLSTAKHAVPPAKYAVPNAKHAVPHAKYAVPNAKYAVSNKGIPKLSTELSPVFLFKNVVDKSYPQIVDNLCITLWIIQKTILKPLILRQTFFCGYWG